ncbi:hypothetical protein ZYGR_0I06390 [Zygosaccharomyces rouxii]|uniref:DNA mismatch repair protein PMS1 n=2 Tax=Zygosaccharomyces rouxii TaxID=4956 RepID=C5DUA4_ZYGRC|nr:uncharacterized protein ZYRO0C15180g [Zygosaccharomyces rouxii]KAH9201461.1 hypothetical protein LQ764DRAFT_233253 [Zygosaccharomyces rouxii]GAV48342.1 hypothetical protein ZYGR_0I06390 [Zygosaccharomyces rouxii]CAR27365.1 ZYRO0C15180p [Zygosaccharomyces rouxii]
MAKINAIGGYDIHRITSGQVVIDLTTALKELIDNSIDANAHHIEVVLKNYGIESIECSDDGDGIEKENHEFLALKHHTSKISTFQDMAAVSTLGFRGEALASLCAVAKVVVTTTTRPPRADKLEYSYDGKLINKSTTSRNRGTTIQLSELFNNLPVRKKEFSKNCKKQFAKCLTMLQSYSVIQDDIKFSVWHVTSNGRKTLALSTTRNQGISKRILSIFGSSSIRGLSEVDLTLDLNPFKGQMLRKYAEDPDFESLDYQIRVQGLISRNSFGCGRTAKDRQLVYINRRPVDYPVIIQCCNEVYKSFNNVQYPAFFLNFELSPQLIDINVTPDKRTVLLHNEKYVIDVLRETLTKYFDDQDLLLPKASFSQPEVINPKKRTAEQTEDDEGQREEEVAEELPERASKLARREPLKAFNGLSPEGSTSISPDRSSRLTADSETTPAVAEKNTNKTNSYKERTTRSDEYKSSNVSRKSSAPITPAKNATNILLDQFAKFHPEEEEEEEKEEEAEEEEKEEEEEGGTNAEQRSPLNNKGLEKFINPSQELDLHSQEEAKESPPRSQTDPVVVEIDDTAVEHQATLTQDDRLVFLSDEPPRKESCCHGNRQSSDEDDSAYASMEPVEINVRVPLPNRDTSAGHTYRSLTDENSSKETKEIECLVLSLPVDSTEFHQINSVRNIVQRQHETALCKNENLDNVQEGENYLTLTIKKSDFDHMQIVGQFNLGFIICTRRIGSNYDLFIVDQHASDEKFNFENLQKTTIFKSQKLIAPLDVDLSAIDELAVMDNLKVFENNGFKLCIQDDEIEGTKVQLTSLPVSKNTIFGIDDFYELVHLLKENQGINRDSIKCSKIRSMLAMRACRSSIMIGKPLTQKTMCKVVRHLSGLDKPWNCPHGRPTMRHLMELKDWNFFHKDYDL